MAVTFVNHGAFGANTNSSGVVAYTLGWTQQVGNILIVCTGNAGSAAVCNSVVGTLNGSFTLIKNSGSVASATSLQTWYVVVTNGSAAETITLTYSIAATISDAAIVHEFSGQNATPIGGTASGTANTAAAGDITTSGSLTATANVGDCVFGAGGNYYGISLAWTKGSTGPTNFSDGTNSLNFDIQSSRGSSDSVAHVVSGYRILTAGDGSYSGGGSYHVQKVAGAVSFFVITQAAAGGSPQQQLGLLGVGS